MASSQSELDHNILARELCTTLLPYQVEFITVVLVDDAPMFLTIVPRKIRCFMSWSDTIFPRPGL